jgi:DNA-binding transcriptional ArsR family regulator
MTTETRVITDSKALSAMSHPQRRRLLDALVVDGPSTVSMLSARVGQAAGNVSHHMKVLAAAELVAEAPDLARDRRERWWRVADKQRHWSSTTFADDPSAVVVADAAASLNLEHHMDKVRAWNANRESDRAGWTESVFSADAWLRLTPEELGALSDEVVEVFRRWRDRALPDDGAQRDPVFVFAHGVPAQP